MRLFISFIITITIITTIAFTGYTFYKNTELNNIIKQNNKDIEMIDYKNQLLKSEINHKNELIKKYQNNNKELFEKIRNLKSNYQNNIKTINIKPKRNYKNYTNNNQKNHYNNNHKYNKNYNRKTYHRYSGYEKLISDSEIKIRPDNRFVSNSMIYGIYKYRLDGIIDCGKTKKIYKIVNECRAYSPYSTDIIYFKKTNLNELKYFDLHDHKIECKYNQKYGIMHDCRAKLY